MMYCITWIAGKYKIHKSCDARIDWFTFIQPRGSSQMVAVVIRFDGQNLYNKHKHSDIMMCCIMDLIECLLLYSIAPAFILN